jgi:methylmalonyl-CoA mutase
MTWAAALNYIGICLRMEQCSPTSTSRVLHKADPFKKEIRIMETLQLNNELHVLDDFPAVSYEEWKAKATDDLKGVPFEKKMITHRYDELEVQPLYTAQSWPSAGDRSGFPGMAPYTRGVKPLEHSLEGWDIRQEVLKPAPAEANAVILEELKHGARSVELKFDAAACSGLDADDRHAAGLCGREGIMIYHRGNLEQVLKNVVLDITPVSVDAGAAFLPGAVLLAAQWAEEGIAAGKVSGSFNADPLGVLMLHGMLPQPLDAAIDQMADLAAWTAKRYPNVKAIRVSTTVYHQAGANSAQELAYAMGTAVEYLRAMTASGIDINTAVRQIAFHEAIGCRFFQAVAKLRALRKLWARVAMACGAGKESIAVMQLESETSRRVLTRHDPWVNLLRNTAACFAGVVGGADAVTTLPMDAAVGSSDEISRHLARNTQLILQEECRLNQVIDPAGGSWFLETLTDQLAEKAWSLFQQVEARGGMTKAALSGYINEQIQAVETRREKEVATRKAGVTGVSEHTNVLEHELSRPAPDAESLRQEAAAGLLKWRRDHGDQSSLETLRSVAVKKNRKPGDLSEASFQAARAGATVGQVASALSAAGSQQDMVEIAPLTLHPYAAAFEELRDATDAYAKAHENKRPKVFLAEMGTAKEFLARANYATDFFEAGGFEPVTNGGFADAQAAAAAFAASAAKIAVICSTDKRYETEVERVAPALRAAGARTVVLAGNPGANEMKYRSVGVNQFIFVKCNVPDILRALLKEEGVL